MAHLPAFFEAGHEHDRGAGAQGHGQAHVQGVDVEERQDEQDDIGGENPLEARSLASTRAQVAIKVRWVSIAPLARPVVPDV
jgi:hypothetical protein